MNTPNILAGYFYPSTMVSRCPRFHACTISKKCQNYDAHNYECAMCESRSNAHERDPNSVPLGGYLAEGEYYPDLQNSIMELERLLNKSFAHPDMEPQKYNTLDVANNMERERKIVDSIQHFTQLGKFTMEEKIMQAIVDPSLKDLLGRLE